MNGYITTSLIEQSRGCSFHSIQHGTDIGITDTAAKIENETDIEILLTSRLDQCVIVLSDRRIIIDINVQSTIDAVTIIISNYITNLKGGIVLFLTNGMTDRCILRHCIVTRRRVQRQRHHSCAALLDEQHTAVIDIHAVRKACRSPRCTPAQVTTIRTKAVTQSSCRVCTVW